MTRPEGAPLDDEMFAVVYDELRRLAYGLTRGHDSPTLNPTALVHEAYIKLSRAHHFRAESAQHLKFSLVRAMRQILIDAARRRSAAMRGGAHAHMRRVALEDAAERAISIDPRDVLDVDLALSELARQHELPARAFELQFFGGLEIAEIADLLGVSEKKVQRLLKLARARLAQALSRSAGASGDVVS
jgi:RNA polymerase sigma factor (TIGR02999 family)